MCAGYDTSSTGWKFDTPRPERPCSTAKDEIWTSYHEEDALWVEKKCDALLAHLEATTKAEIFLVGVGDEVKKFIALACKPGRRIKCAQLDANSSAATVATVMKATFNSTRRDSDVAVPVIHINAPACLDHMATSEETLVVSNGAWQVTAGDELSPSDIKASIEEVEAALDMPVNKRLARTAIFYFLDQISKAGHPLAGSLIGGRTSHIFVDPAYPGQSPWHSYINKVLTRLTKNILKQHKATDEPVVYDMDVGGGQTRSFKYSKVVTYSLQSNITPALIDAVRDHTEWCPPEDQLKKVSVAGEDVRGSKRKTPGAEPDGSSKVAKSSEGQSAV